jgi:hypothetical protein
MYYPELNRAGSHGTSGMGFVIVLNVRYVSLITCGLAKDDAVGTRLALCGPRGVIHITQEVIDKAGLNRLLVPHQSLFLSPIQSSLLLTISCLALPTPTPSPLSPFVTVLGSLPLPRRSSTSNGLSRRGVLGLPHIHPLWMSTRGPNVV